MSLISEALKKAQRARSPDVSGGTSAGFRRSSGVPMKAVIMIAVGAALFFGIVGAVVISILRRGDEAALAAAKTVTAPAAANTATPAAPSTVSPGVQVPAPPAASTIVSEAAISSQQNALPPASAARSATTTDPGAARRTPPLAPAAGTGKQEVRVGTYIDEIKVITILPRPNQADSKVMMVLPGKEALIYRVNDIVDRALNIRLTAIELENLTFVDENGVTYTKRN